MSSLRDARALLERALFALRDVTDPDAPVRDVEAHVAQALRHVWAASGAGGDSDRLRDALTGALSHTREALGALQAVPARVDAVAPVLEPVARALGALAQVSWDPDDRVALAPRPDPRLVVPATVGAPALVAMPRDALVPAVPMPELPPAEEPAAPEPAPAPPVTTLAELDAFLASLPPRDPVSGEVLPPDDVEETTTRMRSLAAPADDAAQRERAEQAAWGVSVAHAAVLADRARVCFEELATFGAMRRPMPDEAWRDRQRTEERLLARVDAVAACGEAVLPTLVKLHEERPMPDPDLTWATVFLFGSLAGDDALAQVARCLAWTDLAAPDMIDRVADALAHAPSPGVTALVAPWLDDADPRRRAVALTACARRGALLADACARGLADADVVVARAAAGALLYAQGDVDRRALALALAHDDEDVCRAAVEASLRRGWWDGYDRAVALTREGRGAFADAALFVAAAAPRTDREALAQALGGPRSPALYEALGALGDVDFVDALLAALRDGPEAHAAAAALALDRITGAGLTKDDPDPQHPDGAQPFRRAWAPPERAEELSADPAAWSSWWAKHRADADPSRRWRWGHPWSPRDEHWELAQPEALPRDRRLAACALAARCGPVALDFEAFVAPQEARLEAIAGALELRHDGRWPTRVGGMR